MLKGINELPEGCGSHEWSKDVKYRLPVVAQLQLSPPPTREWEHRPLHSLQAPLYQGQAIPANTPLSFQAVSMIGKNS